MKHLILSTTLLASPALALQVPAPGKDDPHICTVVYKPDDVLDVHAIAGHTVAIRFGSKERIQNDGSGHVTLSDSAHMQRAIAEGSNVLWLKPTMRMEPQPILVRTMTEQGTPRDYVIQWTATSLPRDAGNTQLASNGALQVTEVPAEPAGPNVCYQITYLYPADEVAAKRAAQVATWSKRQAAAAEIALHRKQLSNDGKNVRYTAQGDASIAPSQGPLDDGESTFMWFSGNLSIPVIYRINPDGTDGDTIGITTEQNGKIILHEVLPKFRLRSGDLVLCIFNHGYNAIGNNPGTGTSSPEVSRDVRE